MKTFGPYTGVVDQVHDGDTLYVRLDVGFDLTVYARVRLYAVNAPELRTAAGVAARDYVRQLLPVGTRVQVVSYGWDKYGGRIDGVVLYGDNQSLAEALLAAGHAVPYLP
jgi:endonuclease YncB( thermonuclease family)